METETFAVSLLPEELSAALWALEGLRLAAIDGTEGPAGRRPNDGDRSFDSLRDEVAVELLVWGREGTEELLDIMR
jgi:hypothetical protein